MLHIIQRIVKKIIIKELYTFFLWQFPFKLAYADRLLMSGVKYIDKREEKSNKGELNSSQHWSEIQNFIFQIQIVILNSLLKW